MIQDLINCLDRNYSKIGCIRNMSIRTILSIYIYLETDVERFLSDISESERCLILSGTLYFRFNTTRVPKMKLASIAKFYDEIHRVNALFITDGSGIYLLQRDLQMYQWQNRKDVNPISTRFSIGNALANFFYEKRNARSETRTFSTNIEA